MSGVHMKKQEFVVFIRDNYPSVVINPNDNFRPDMIAWAVFYDIVAQMGVPYQQLETAKGEVFIDRCLDWIKQNPELVEFHLI